MLVNKDFPIYVKESFESVCNWVKAENWLKNQTFVFRE